MKIALIGYGKMGKRIHECAESRGHSIVAICTSSSLVSSAPMQHSLSQADICIDFSSPYVILDNIKTLASLNKNIVIGTTGWQEHLPIIQQIVDTSQIGILHSPNFSLGIALFLNLIQKAAQLISPFKQYDVAGIEIHHNQKIDSPSGTAKAIENCLNTYLPAPMSFSSVRVGSVPGTHSILFDSPFDTITLTHEARNRDGFAHGAITAAEWLQGKKGVFSLDDLLLEKIL